MPSSIVNAGRTLRPRVLLTASLTCSTVASWPVVRTDAMDERAAGSRRSAPAATAAALAAAPAPAAHGQRCQRSTARGRG